MQQIRWRNPAAGWAILLTGLGGVACAVIGPSMLTYRNYWTTPLAHSLAYDRTPSGIVTWFDTPLGFDLGWIVACICGVTFAAAFWWSGGSHFATRSPRKRRRRKQRRRDRRSSTSRMWVAVAVGVALAVIGIWGERVAVWGGNYMEARLLWVLAVPALALSFLSLLPDHWRTHARWIAPSTAVLLGLAMWHFGGVVRRGRAWLQGLVFTAPGYPTFPPFLQQLEIGAFYLAVVPLLLLAGLFTGPRGRASAWIVVGYMVAVTAVAAFYGWDRYIISTTRGWPTVSEPEIAVRIGEVLFVLPLMIHLVAWARTLRRDELPVLAIAEPAPAENRRLVETPPRIDSAADTDDEPHASGATTSW